MEAVATEQVSEQAPALLDLCRRPAPLAQSDLALLNLGRFLKQSGYHFTAVTPSSHRIVNSRPHGPATLRDVFGWSRPFRQRDLAPEIVSLMAEAGVLQRNGSWLRSGVRFASLGRQLFVHSAFPTDQPDAVFFGPDTYRFARLIRQWLPCVIPRRILDIGAGSGAGGLHATSLIENRVRPSVWLSDVNDLALRYSRINAVLNNLAAVTVVNSDLFEAVDGHFDLIIANPPYLVDQRHRLYRHGGGEFGSRLSCKIVKEGIERLVAGGRLILYTGSAIVDGIDLFHDTMRTLLKDHDVRWTYEEIDPDVFGEELERPPYDRVDRIAVVGVCIDRG